MDRHGRQHQHHHHHREEEEHRQHWEEGHRHREEECRHGYPPTNDPPYPPPQTGFSGVQHLSHESGTGYGYPPAAAGAGNIYPPPQQPGFDGFHHGYDPSPAAGGLYPPPQQTGFSGYGHSPAAGSLYPPPAEPGFSAVHHVSHECGGGGSGYAPAPAAGNLYPSEAHRSSPSWDALHRLQTFRVFTKADEKYSLTVRDGEVVLAPQNHNDQLQHWIKDLKYSTKVKDQQGFPAFALINKSTGQAIKHSTGATKSVELVRYNPDSLDMSVLWSESLDTGENFRCIRMVNNIGLNFDAFHGDKDHGGVRDGTTIVLWEWLKGPNQRWKIIPY